ncbi:ATP-binding cassette domain-containing protein [Streptomyces alkaliphilus]|uniref:ATP-binding cassette domain-containing protein n=1 Tax=Streptomyces alkaliphilus TaxID=1472722 RepID=A0A7W3T954_9ACTN|nr:ATP-binding cassette domain-containing protein [Streptomyces alkaliphilus]MBB0242571.1 ATP-binding cassette domain-containing protein [Streptomyces alkaliphilus]
MTADSSTFLTAEGLRLETADGPVLDGVDLSLTRGESLAVVGSSGSGKTTLALALLGHLRDGIRHTGGRVRVRGADILPHAPAGVRGSLIGYVGQDPGAALNPYARIRTTLLTAAGRLPRGERDTTVRRLLERVGLPGDTAFARRYPHQLSGGQQQRVVLAAALARDPAVLILDEPTTALDPPAKAGVLRELGALRERGIGMVWISHDLIAVGAFADRVIVLDGGRIAEEGPARRVLTAPRSAAGRRLVAAGTRSTARHTRTPPASGRAGAPTAVTAPDTGAPLHGANPPDTAAGSDSGKTDGPVLRASGLVARHGSTTVLHGVDLAVEDGECLAVLGVSGVGKSTLARCLTGLHPAAAGTVALRGTPLAPDVRGRDRRERAAVGLVAQNPAEALHPRQDVRTALVRPLKRLCGITDRAELDRRVRDLLESVHLPPGFAGRLPGELSGGQRQRVALARALAARPSVLICDEATSALDTVAQEGVLALLAELRARTGLAVLLITHDARVARDASDRLLVLADGRVAATGPTPVLLPPGDSPEEQVTRLLTAPAGAVRPTPYDTDRGASLV